MPAKKYEVNGFEGTLREVCEHEGVNFQGVRNRIIHNNMNINEAINDFKLSMHFIKRNGIDVQGTLRNFASERGFDTYLFNLFVREGLNDQEAFDLTRKKWKAFGHIGTIRQICENEGLLLPTIAKRVANGCDLEDATKEPVRYIRERGLAWNGKYEDLSEICTAENVNIDKVRDLMRHCYTLAGAISKIKNGD